MSPTKILQVRAGLAGAQPGVIVGHLIFGFLDLPPREEQVSKYDDLTASLAALIQAKQEYEERTFSFMGELRSGFLQYLGAPDAALRFFRVSEGYIPQKRVGVGAAELGPDGYWHIGLVLIMKPEHSFGGSTTYPLRIRTLHTEFLVGVGDYPGEFRIPDDSPGRAEAFRSLFDTLYVETKRHLDLPMEERQGQADGGVGEIGFHNVS